MSVTMAKGDGVTTLTITTNPKSNWPLLCQILGKMCYSPVCSVSRGVKQRLGRDHTVLGTIQIFIGVLVLAVAGLTTTVAWDSRILYKIYGLAPVFIVSGIMCILMERFPSPCLVVLTVIVNMASAGVAIAAIVVCGIHLGKIRYLWPRCENYNSRGYYTTGAPEIVEKMSRSNEMCMHYRGYVEMILRGLDIMMIVFVTLQLCVAISSCVLGLKSLCKKKGDGKSEEAPEVYNPLISEGLSIPAV